MLGRVIEWMYPTVCPVCQKVLGKGKIICDTCKDELHIINEPRCAKCGKPLQTVVKHIVMIAKR